jgi:hypothetical protein
MSTIIRLYESLSVRLGKEMAEDLTSYIDNKIEGEVEEKIKMLATRTDISGLRIEMKQDKAEIIKWMFIFWIGQVAVTFTIVLAFLKK